MDKPPRFPFFIAGCVVLVLLGIAHSIANLQDLPAPPSEEWGTLLRLMTTLEEAQTHRTMMELYKGFSWFFTLAPVVMAAAGLVLVPIGCREPSAIKRMATVYTVGCALFLGSSLVYWFIAPTSFLALSTLLFLISAVRDGRPRSA